MALAHIVKLTAGVAAGVDRVAPAVLKEVKVGNADRVTEQMNQNGDIQPHTQQPARQDCLTCPRGGHSIGEVCRGVEARGCFACGQAGHFKGAPLCPGDVAQ